MSASAANIPNHLPLHEGPFVPGCLDIMSGYGEKSVFMRLWYPTSLSDIKKHADKWPRWMDDTYMKGFSAILGIWPIFLKIVRRWYSGDIHIPGVWGAEVLADQAQQFPTVVFSHGLGACRFFYSILCMQLASHGIIVAAIEHKDESSAATFFYENEKKHATGKKSFMLFRPVDETDSGNHLVIRKRQLAIRANECSRALDFLIGVNDGRCTKNLLDPENKHNILEQLKGRLDLETVTLMGHSFGGATTLVTASKDDRFKQLLVLDSWLFGLKNEEEMPETLKKFPKLFLNADYFQLENNLKVMRRFVSTNDSKYTVKRTTHEHLCDSPRLVGLWLNRDKQRIDYILGLRINYHLVLSYLKQRIGEGVKWSNEEFLQENGHHIVQEISVRENSQAQGTAKL